MFLSRCRNGSLVSSCSPIPALLPYEDVLVNRINGFGHPQPRQGVDIYPAMLYEVGSGEDMTAGAQRQHQCEVRAEVDSVRGSAAGS